MVLTLSGIFLSSFLVAFSGALMPGPLLTVTISETPKHGALTGPILILGHAILELSLILALILGLAPLFQSTTAFIIISFSGAFILLYMAFSMFKNLPSLQLKLEGGERKNKNLILSGIFSSLANPYWTVWWASIGLAYILNSLKLGFLGILFFFIGHILADLLWYSFISFGLSRGEKFLTDKHYKILIAICAVFLIVFSVYFFYSAFVRIISL